MPVASPGRTRPAISPGLGVTMSVGLAVHREAPGVPALLRLADARLYRAKQLGRNCVVAERAVD